jgi:hypothetical protein
MKSLIISLILSFFVGFSFMSLIDPNSQSWVSKLPTWMIYPVVIALIIGYLITLYWGFSGMWHTQRLANFGGFILSVLGLGIIGAGFYMQMGNDTAKEGQFEYSQTAENLREIALLKPILEQAKLKESDIKMLTYWHLIQSKDGIAICMQQGKIIGLNIKNISLKDVSCISKLSNLASLTLNNCDLTKIENLNLPKAERLNLNNNKLTNLTGIVAPKVKWLDLDYNQLNTWEGIANLPQAQYVSYAGNAITDFPRGKKSE